MSTEQERKNEAKLNVVPCAGPQPCFDQLLAENSDPLTTEGDKNLVEEDTTCP